MNIEQYREHLKNIHCLVIGDAMLDEYILGDVGRISPEAPIPVVHMQECKHVPGGAANVAANIKSLGLNTTLVSVIGNNHEAETLKNVLNLLGIGFEGIVSPKRITTIKTRIMNKNHQIVRVDKEQTTDIDDTEEKFVLEKIRNIIKYVDIIIISDYTKGVCTDIICKTAIELATKHKKNIIVDSKNANWSKYRNAFLIKPNFLELKKATDMVLHNDLAGITLAARNIIQNYNIQNVLVTRSQEGMVLVNNSDACDFNAEVHEVFDVSGAGDTVIATVAAFLSVGVDLTEAVKISNIAAGIVVRKVGTCAVSFDELALQINSTEKQKCVSNTLAVSILNQYKHQGKKIVFTNGCFDILHIGHIKLLTKAKQLGDILVIGLNSDVSTRRLKGEERPINNEGDRAAVLAALEMVDLIVLFEEDTPYNLIKDIMPDVLVKGADYMLHEIAGHDVVVNSGGQVIIFPLIEGKSTSSLINSVNQHNNRGNPC